MKEIAWSELGFSWMDTKCFLRSSFDGKRWSALETLADPMISVHVAATALHYGQAAFEGLKAFTMKDGRIASFRPEENARRMARTAARVMMEPVPEDLYLEAVDLVIAKNREFVPPYGTGASLYIRPLLFGSGPRIGVQPAETYGFYVLAMPVGPYYKDGFKPVRAMVQEEYDRAAPRGVGNVKVGGNYAAGMLADKKSKEKGYPISLFLDSVEHRYVDEFGTSNFLGITKDGRYVTPASSSILPSITNMSLQELASDFGLKVERRRIDFAELKDFAEVGACGTAAVITPVHSITRGDTTLTFGAQDRPGEMLSQLFKELQGIQYGEVPDRHGWMRRIE